MAKITIPSMRDNTTIARVAAMDSGGKTTRLESGEVVVTTPGRLFLSRRGIESALGYPLRHSAWRGLKDHVEDGVVAIADDMTLLIERNEHRARVSAPGAEAVGDSGYTTQRYRLK